MEQDRASAGVIRESRVKGEKVEQQGIQRERRVKGNKTEQQHWVVRETKIKGN